MARGLNDGSGEYKRMVRAEHHLDFDDAYQHVIAEKHGLILANFDAEHLGAKRMSGCFRKVEIVDSGSLAGLKPLGLDAATTTNLKE